MENDGFCDLFEMHFGFSLRTNAYGGYFEMLLGCLMRTDGFCDLSMMSSVADIELL